MITFVINSLKSGGSQRVMAFLAGEVVRRGQQVSVFSNARGEPFYDLPPEVRLIFPKKEIRYGNAARTFRDRVLAYRDLFCHLRESRPEAVLSFPITASGAVIPMCKILGIKVFACEQQAHNAHSGSLAVRSIRRWIYPMATGVNVLTERDKRDYYGRFMKKVTVIPNPVLLEPCEGAGVIERDNTILAVGSLDRFEVKGFDTLLKVFKKIAKDSRGWDLLIAGRGDKGPVERLIKELGLTERVKLLGALKHMGPVYKKSSIFVLSSRREGFPLALLEAMSQGMACAAFDCFTGPREIITHGKDGLLVKDQDQEEMVHALSRLLKDPALRREFGEEAVETSKNFSSGRTFTMWREKLSQEGVKV